MRFLVCWYKVYLLLFFLAAHYQLAIAQPDDIDVLIDKIKKEYPAYHNKITNRRFDSLVNEIKRAKNRDTFWMLSKITNVFNDMHLQVRDTGFAKRADTSGCNSQFASLTNYLNNAAIIKDNAEGYWLNNNNDCVIGIKRLSAHPLMYQCFLVESLYTTFPTGFMVASLEKNNNIFETVYSDPVSGTKLYLKSVFRSNNMLAIGPYAGWSKVQQYHYPMLRAFVKRSSKASASIIDSATFLIQIPACSKQNIPVVDSLVKANQSVLAKTKTLIVDIRNNLGGYINVYEPLLPFIYTNPIQRAGGYEYCVDDVIENEKETIADMEHAGKDSLKIADEKARLDTMKKNKGKFIWDAGDTLQYGAVLQFPKRVALLTGYNNMSAAELMIFNFKQSKKVTTFGERTYGAVDNSDFYAVPLASARYILYIPSSTTVIPYHEHEYFDGIGIPPDVPINSDTTDWIAFVKQYYEKNHQ